MNIHNWILAAASPPSDEYHSQFIRPLLIFPYSPSITAGRRAGDQGGDDDDNDDDDDDHRAVNRGKLKLFPRFLNVLMKSLLKAKPGSVGAGCSPSC